MTDYTVDDQGNIISCQVCEYPLTVAEQQAGYYDCVYCNPWDDRTPKPNAWEKLKNWFRGFYG